MTDAQFEAIQAQLRLIAKNTTPPTKFWRRLGMLSIVVSIGGGIFIVEKVIQLVWR
jgi:hypothetical protein